ncbi:hypothetical protein HC928_12480 [bacterium]|nr:hypothetical protein [bacterium]
MLHASDEFRCFLQQCRSLAGIESFPKSGVEVLRRHFSCSVDISPAESSEFHLLTDPVCPNMLLYQLDHSLGVVARDSRQSFPELVVDHWRVDVVDQLLDAVVQRLRQRLPVLVVML